MKHLISIADWSAEDLRAIIDRGRSFIPIAQAGSPKAFFDRKVTLFLVEPSTRTCDSYNEAGQLLGCRLDPIRGGKGTSLEKDESLSATARTEAGYNGSVFVLRSKLEGGARWVAKMLESAGFRTAVQNAGDGTNEHPSQAFLDLLTILQRFGRIENFTIGIVGDLKNSRTVHSLIRALKLLPGIRVVLVSSPEVRLQRWYLAGLDDVVESDSMEALRGCDIVMVTRVQKERFALELDYQKIRGKFVVDRKVLEMLGPQTLIMHPQPIADNEIHPEIWQHPQVIMDEQARMGVPMRMALLEWSLTEGSAGLSLPEHPRIDILQEGIVHEVLAKKHQSARYFTPIEHGTVVDHLRHGLGAMVLSILGLDVRLSDGAFVLSEGLRSSKVPNGRKAALAMEHQFLTDQQKAAITLLSPEATFNEFRDGSVVKQRVGSLGDIQGVGRCPNPNCVTKLDVQAALFPRFSVRTGSDPHVRCHYCQQHFQREEIFS